MARAPEEIVINMRFNMKSVHETIERMRRMMAAMGMITPPRTVLEMVGDTGTDHLQFTYVNWRGDLHTYQVEVEGMTYDHHGDDGGGEVYWQINGHVVLRDGAPRPEMGDNTRRSFKLAEMKNIKQVKPSELCICRSYHERTGEHSEQCPLYGGGTDPLNLDTLGPTEV
jgi:hypothetical protein